MNFTFSEDQLLFQEFYFSAAGGDEGFVSFFLAGHGGVPDVQLAGQTGLAFMDPVDHGLGLVPGQGGSQAAETDPRGRGRGPVSDGGRGGTTFFA